jgi:hypothetical protein
MTTDVNFFVKLTPYVWYSYAVVFRVTTGETGGRVNEGKQRSSVIEKNESGFVFIVAARQVVRAEIMARLAEKYSLMM